MITGRSTIFRLTIGITAVAAVSVATAAAQDAASCSNAAMNSVLTSFAKGLKLEIRCPLSQVSREDYACGAITPRIDKPQVDLRTMIENACPAPNAGAALCASSAAYLYGDVIFGTLDRTFEPDTERRRCRKAIAAASAKVAETTALVLRKCNDQAIREAPGYGPVGPSCTDATGSPQAKIAAAEQKLRDQVAKRCGGVDRAFGGGDDLDPQDDLGFPASCQGGPGCTAPVDEIAELSECAICIAAQSVHEAIDGAMALPLQAATECEVAVTRSYSLLATSHLREKSSCEDRVMRDEGAPACPSLDMQQSLALYDGEAVSTALASCGALDPQDDLGFPPTCPDVGTCGGIDVGVLSGALECLQCVTDERTQFLVSTIYPVSAFEPDDLQSDCHRTIGSRLSLQSASFASRKLRSMETCERERTCGQTSGTCPDERTADGIDRSRANAVETITEDCVGVDPQDLGFGSTCPAAYTCGVQETDSMAGLISCLTCITEAVADELHGFYVPGP